MSLTNLMFFVGLSWWLAWVPLAFSSSQASPLPSLAVILPVTLISSTDSSPSWSASEDSSSLAIVSISLVWAPPQVLTASESVLTLLAPATPFLTLWQAQVVLV